MTRAESSRASPAVLWTLVLVALLATRLPSLVEPAGADQSLYAYVGQRINAGDVPYRDAWDQKPPAIHFLYSAIWRVWPHESAVAGADLIATGVVAWLLVLLGRRTLGTGVGVAAACLFLLLGNPAIQRLGGVRVRAQCETFIAVAVAAAIVLVAGRRRRSIHFLLAGAFLGLAFWLKYNAGIYALPVLAMAMSSKHGAPDRPPSRSVGGSRLGSLLSLAFGFAIVAAAFLSYFAAHGALTDLWLATVTYNLQYSSETYAGFRGVLDYVLFPLDRAKLDLLWYFGGIGVIVAAATRAREAGTWIAIGWIVAACISIIVNGARDLPQYFVQAHPALAFSAGIGLWPLFKRGGSKVTRIVLLLVIAAGLWKVGDEPVAIRLGGLSEAAHNAAFDLSYVRRQIDRDAFLARFQQQRDTKYVPLSAEQLTRRVRDTTKPSDRILIFGFAASVYVNAPRQSASRFFWSRPVVVEFGRGIPGYGSAGLLDDLQRSSPALVALQKHWEVPTPKDFFMNTPPLRAWLERGYSLEEDTPEFSVWRRRAS